MAVIIILILRETSNIPRLQTRGKHEFKGEDAMQSAIECRGYVLCVFPQIDGVAVLRLYLLIVVWNIGCHKLPNGKCLGPGVCIGIV